MGRFRCDVGRFGIEFDAADMGGERIISKYIKILSNNVNIHQNIKYINNINHCCPYCPDVFQSYVRLNDHIQWEHGLDEIDENAIVMKNCESQQFFQCEICDHF